MFKERRKIILIGLIGLLIAAFLLSLSCGQYELSMRQVIASIARYFDLPWFGEVTLTTEQEAVLWHIRMPRTLVGLLVGAGLAVSGAVLQGLFSNPLADPGIIGVSSGSSLGAVIAIALGLTSTALWGLPVCAFVGAITAMLLTVFLAMRHGRIPMLTLLLSGVVVGMLLSAITAMLLTVFSEQKMSEYLFWTIGGLDYRRWEHVVLGGVPIVVGIAVMLLVSRHLNVLALGEQEASAVGMPVMRFRILFLSLAAMTTAASVCISGNIGFVGLVVPHAMRLLIGADHRYLLPYSLLAGSSFLVLCDSLGRILWTGGEIRVGIMTALLGTPYFLFLLRRIQKGS